MFRLAPEGFAVIAISFLPLAISLIFDNQWVSIGFAGFFLFTLSFFRDPKRRCEAKANTVYSPADGTIMFTEKVDYKGQDYHKIAIFLSVFNCHVNRVPYPGKVISATHLPGKFLAAFRPDCDEKNERYETIMDTDHGEMKFSQITGAIARRIFNHLQPHQLVTAGERFGMIRFGSRTDLYIPATATVLVKKGDKVKGGLTPFATF